MNTEQRQRVIDRLADILGEECESYALAFELKDDEGSTYFYSAWGGGFNAALGLSMRLHRRLLTANDQPASPPDDHEEWKQA